MPSESGLPTLLLLLLVLVLVPDWRLDGFVSDSKGKFWQQVIMISVPLTISG